MNLPLHINYPIRVLDSPVSNLILEENSILLRYLLVISFQGDLLAPRQYLQRHEPATVVGTRDETGETLSSQVLRELQVVGHLRGYTFHVHLSPKYLVAIF